MRRQWLSKLGSAVAVAIIIVLSTQAASRSQEFALRNDGTVRIGGLEFASMRDYLRSDYFRDNGMRCKARVREGAGDSALARSAAHCTNSLTSIQSEYWGVPILTIPVWWHVIYRTDGLGYISDATINAQMEALNQDYRAISGTKGQNGYDVRIQFKLAGITRNQSNAWFSDATAEEKYKLALARDPEKFVNIYTNDAGGALGYAYLPDGSAGAWWDGIVLYFESVGGRDNSFYPYNQGRTLVHEMGHYLGLFHTFEGGCTNGYDRGDLIVDTNAEAAPNFDVCTSVSTCGSPDPIHNYMDYSYDHCMYEFSREQANRAVCSLVNYRPGLFEESAVIPPLLSPLILK